MFLKKVASVVQISTALAVGLYLALPAELRSFPANEATKPVQAALTDGAQEAPMQLVASSEHDPKLASNLKTERSGNANLRAPRAEVTPVDSHNEPVAPQSRTALTEAPEITINPDAAGNAELFLGARTYGRQWTEEQELDFQALLSEVSIEDYHRLRQQKRKLFEDTAFEPI